MEDWEKSEEEWLEGVGEVLGIQEVHKESIMGMGFQVCSEVRKPLAAVWRICRRDDVVQFGPTSEACFVQNIFVWKKVGLRKKGGAYVMDVEFVYGGKVVGMAEITIDSGAEESVIGELWEHVQCESRKG